MGLLRWMRGGDDNSAAGNALGAGMAEIDALFRPSKHKQTEHIQESRRRRVDIANGADSDIDLDSGVAVIRRRDRGAVEPDVPANSDASADTDVSADSVVPAHPDVPAAADSRTVAPSAPHRRHAPITRRGAAASPAAMTTLAASAEPKD